MVSKVVLRWRLRLVDAPEMLRVKWALWLVLAGGVLEALKLLSMAAR